ncbi:hypothetical protein [Methylobacterium sp. Leaf89]|uniref:hypothetical protein n=1 Tax=Methylobacterium sp. Leaf89 TaxID=1736245 RepID=UPI0012E9534F|nr:hypothetical protein [Methylobacterium sp. Leaf89]
MAIAVGSQANPSVGAPTGATAHVAHAPIQAADALSLDDAQGVALTISITAQGLGLNRLDPWCVPLILLNTCLLSHRRTDHKNPHDHGTNCKFSNQHDYP